MNPVPFPHKFGDVLHIHIGYSCSSGLNGIKYRLFVVNRATQYNLIYDIKLIKTDILSALQAMINDIGHTPGKIVSYFDHKLMGASVQEYMDIVGCKLEAAPPKQQHQNWIVKRN